MSAMLRRLLLTRLHAPAEEGQDLSGAADPAPDTDTEARAETAGEGSDEPARDEKGRFIPKERLDKEISKRKALEEELRNEREQRRAGVQADKDSELRKNLETEITDLEGQYEEHMKTGATDKAAELGRKLRAKERELAKLENETLSARSREAIKEEIRVEALIEKLVGDYPSLDPANEDEYDQDTVDMIEGLRARYLAAGKRPSAALREAVEKVMKRAEKPASEDKPVEKGLSRSGADDRREEAVKKALDAKARQPQKTVAGKDSDALGGDLGDPKKLARLSDAEWDKLPDDVKRKARGDFVS
jgi:hypothetical protein